MLVLTRKLNEEIVIGNDIKITLLRVRGNTVRIGIEAPREVRVARAELANAIAKQTAAPADPEAFELSDREQPFAHPPATDKQAASQGPSQMAAEAVETGNSPAPFSAVTTPRATVSRAERADNGASLRRAPLSQFISAT